MPGKQNDTRTRGWRMRDDITLGRVDREGLSGKPSEVSRQMNSWRQGCFRQREQQVQRP